ncbi:nitroreductase [Alloscardovia macacae]|uniref:Nitroreductase n=1 Tax=Alloscardovia macacae TaxID=1160091 RepID=A0A261F5H3_9BIFI|nr:nitroreductase [Alloscardovia macacae]OZG54370.1 nitroreductase [Alloscardovia macacae]
MEFTEVLTQRHSVREFSSRPVEREVLREIVQLAQHTPSWANAQPVRVYVVSGQAAVRLRQEHEKRVQEGEPARAEIAPMARADWPERYQEIMRQWTVEFKKTFEPGQVHFNQAQAQLFRAPAFAFLTVPRGIFDWALLDAGAFAHALMLAAYDRGVDSIIAYSTVLYPDEVRAAAGIPDSEMLAVGIALGYASENPLNSFVPSRISTDEVVTFVE